MVLADGRVLGWSEFGDSAGQAVFGFHGTPSSRLDFAPSDAAARELGLWIIAPDRPGHGDSSPAPGRTLLSWADDVAALADHLGIDRFAVLGFSGGGPYALACAAALGDRVTAVVGASAAGPVDHPGGLAGMSVTDKILTWFSLHAPRAGRAWMRTLAVGARLSPRIAVWGEAGELGPGAREVLARLGPPSTVMAPFHESMRQGGAATIEDFALLSLPWGFDLREIAVPVVLFHGAADRVVPLHQAEHLATAIPGAELVLVDDVGHILFHREVERVLAAIPT